MRYFHNLEPEEQDRFLGYRLMVYFCNGTSDEKIRWFETINITGEERHLSIRAFTESQKLAAFERQRGVCPRCGRDFVLEEMEADHITPWAKGGTTTPDNCQMLCRDCNRRKSDA